MEANGIVQNIESQIESCKALLAVFQEERSIYREGRGLSKDEMSATLERKCKLLSLFDGQRKLLKSIEAEGSSVPEEVKEKRKELMRALGSVLEQLLVIDQENERLMREAATTVRRPSFAAAVAARQRPSLQMQLPLMPFSQATAPSRAPINRAPLEKIDASVKPAKPASSAVAPAPAISKFVPPAVEMPSRPKSHLRVYSSLGGAFAGPKYA